MSPVTEQHGKHGCGCDECELEPFSRNNYFTGKLLLERDFSDEQRYFREKIRHHNMRLHGTGVVCGLEISQHPSADCRSRFVRLAPGTAIDCCGNEILVSEPEDVELATLAGIAAIDPKDDKLHEIQLCLRYRECGAEPVPVLYDECGCDDDRCLPNRILESHRVDAILDPPVSGSTWPGPGLSRAVDLALPGAAALTPVGDQLLVAAGTEIHLVDKTGAVVTTDLAQTVHGVDVAPGGGFYATREDGSGGLVVSVLDAGLALLHDVAVPGSSAPATTGTVADGRLVLLQPSTGTLTVYGSDLAGGSPVPPKETTVDKDRSLLAVHPVKALAYVAAAPGSPDPALRRVDVVDLDAATVTAFPDLEAPPTALSASAGHLVVTTEDKQVSALDAATGARAGVVGLVGAAADIAGTPWAWAAAASGGQSVVQPVSVGRLSVGRTDAAGPGLGFAGDATVVGVGVGKVFVAYDGAGADPGGIAVFDVSNRDCRSEWEQLGDCPSCAQPDCVVVATVHGYRPGFSVLDADPDADPAADEAAKVARIDNHAGRVRLRSTVALQSAVECLFGEGTGGGGSGPAGPPGRDGQDGQDGRDGRDGTDGTDGVNGTNGSDGRDGVGLQEGLVQIDELSWKHRDTVLIDKPVVIDGNGDKRFGVVIHFTGEVDASLVDAEHVFTVDAPNPFAPDAARELGMLCRCGVPGEVVAVDVVQENGGLITMAQANGQQFTKAIAFVLDDRFQRLARATRERLDRWPDLWVRLNGEFVVDRDGNAIDAEFTRAELPTGDRPAGETHGIQGGLFQSWFDAEIG